jgi:hypothetical protein
MKDLLNPGYKKKDCVEVTSSNLENLQSENLWLASKEIIPPCRKTAFSTCWYKKLSSVQDYKYLLEVYFHHYHIL